MRTYFCKNLSQASDWEKSEIIKKLEKCPKESLATIQWNYDDSLYGISYVTCENTSDEGLVWHYEPVESLLAEIKAQL